MSEEKTVPQKSTRRNEYNPDEVKSVVDILDQNALLNLINDELPSYTGPKMLRLTKLGISSLGQLSCLDHLNRLDLSYNKLKSVRSLEVLRELTYVNLNCNMLSGKGIRGLFSLEQLVFLNLGNNRIGIIPDFAFAKMNQLKCLLLNNNKLENVSFVSILTELNTLVLSFNRISSIPEDAFNSLGSLRKLSLGHNQLREFPPVFHLTSLKELNLNSNKITSIPDSISSLTRLTLLDIGNNLIENVESLSILSTLPQLTKLNVSQNTFYGEMKEEDLERVNRRVQELLPQLTVLNNRQLALGKERKELRKRHFEEKQGAQKKETVAKKVKKESQGTAAQNSKSHLKNGVNERVSNDGENTKPTKFNKSNKANKHEKLDQTAKSVKEKKVSKAVEREESTEHDIPEKNAESFSDAAPDQATKPVGTTELAQSGVLSVETSKETHESTADDVKAFLMKGKDAEMELDGWD